MPTYKKASKIAIFLGKITKKFLLYFFTSRENSKIILGARRVIKLQKNMSKGCNQLWEMVDR